MAFDLFKRFWNVYNNLYLILVLKRMILADPFVKLFFQIVVIPISTGKKRYTNFGQNGGEIWEIVEIGIDMYIYSWSGEKN